jgi:hypothetical protein
MASELTPAQLEQRGQAAVTHGARSERQIVHRATVEKRRWLRQNGLRLEDIDPIGRALLTNWARAAAALSLMDAEAQRGGWLDEDGEPRGFARLYVSMLNAERRAINDLAGYQRRRQANAPLDDLNAYLTTTYRRKDGGDE